MKNRGELWVDPTELGAHREEADLEFVIVYIEPDVTRAVLSRAAAMTSGLNARFSLVAVHTIPYPASFGEPGAIHSFLVEQLQDLCQECKLPVSAEVVTARAREDGFRHALKPGSTVLVGSRKRWWRTTEESLARSLARDGHKVVLVHVEVNRPGVRE
jgi:hypothetical protein